MIEVKNITKKYGNFVAVDNISFTINEGEIVGLLGPNGAGKSTTMNTITGFIEQTDGEVTINGYDTIRKPKKAKSYIGYMPEGVPLYEDLNIRKGELPIAEKISDEVLSLPMFYGMSDDEITYVIQSLNDWN